MKTGDNLSFGKKKLGVPHSPLNGKKSPNSIWLEVLKNGLFTNEPERATVSQRELGSGHTFYLSQTVSVKKKLPGVNLYGFNAKNWQITV